MWSEGSIAAPNDDGTYTVCKYRVKHFDEPSEKYGIDGGRISKLMIKRNGEIVCNYDRCWDIKPVDEDTEFMLAILIKDYN